MANKLEQYQSDLGENVEVEFRAGHKHVMVWAPTRSGKTVIFTDIVHRTLSERFTEFLAVDCNNEVLILVHDEKILKQIIKTIYAWHSIIAVKITSKTKTLPPRSLFGGSAPRVFVAMVETINNRLKLPSFLHEMRYVGLIIADEAHLSNFKKIYRHPKLESILRLGFSATPISAEKDDPLYPTYFSQIVIGPSMKFLQSYNLINPERGVVKEITYVLDQIPDKEKFMELTDIQLDAAVGEELSGNIQVKNTINAYIQKAYGKRALCFNSSKAQSKLVCLEMRLANLNARHIDSDCSEEEILASLAWFENTPGAILCNVGMTKTGFDAPWCEVVIQNCLTRSIANCKQLQARASTPWKKPDGTYKTVAIILDMCNNTKLHGELSDDVDWKKIFLNPKYPVPGPAPKKECESCHAINSASARECCVCGNPFDFKAATVDNVERSMKLVTSDIDVSHTIEVFSGRNEYAAMWDILRQVAFIARKRIGEDGYLLETEEFEEIWVEAQTKLREWREKAGKKTIEHSYASIRENLKTKLEDYGFLLKLETEGIMVGKKIKI